MRQERDFFAAKRTAARTVCGGWARSGDLPTDLEVREALQRLMPVAGVDLDWRGTADNLENSRDADVPSMLSDRYAVYASLLEPLEAIDQPRASHPEGDVLYHSLQVYELVKQARPYDVDLQLAALLHDVGKGIDPADHIAAGLAVLGESIGQRTAWLIEHHLEARKRRDGSLGARASRRLRNHEWFEDLDLLCECDRDGRVPGAVVPEWDEALLEIQRLEWDAVAWDVECDDETN